MVKIKSIFYIMNKCVSETFEKIMKSDISFM